MAKPTIDPRKLAVMMIPGTLAWALIIGGAVSGNDTLLGVGVGLVLVSVVAGLAIKGRKYSSERDEVIRIWREGTPARAKVVDISTRGGGLNDNPRVEFQLEVRPAEGEPYPVELSAIIDQLAIPRIQPECEIDVRVDPKDRTKVALDNKLVYPRYE